MHDKRKPTNVLEGEGQGSGEDGEDAAAVILSGAKDRRGMRVSLGLTRTTDPILRSAQDDFTNEPPTRTSDTRYDASPHLR